MGFSYKIHRLVAQAFIPNPENKPCVNHKDFNRLNNHIDNLEWVTHKENIHYSLAKNRWTDRNPRKGSLNHNAKLKEEWIPTIRLLLKEGHSAHNIAELYGTTDMTIQAILSGKTWKHV